MKSAHKRARISGRAVQIERDTVFWTPYVNLRRRYLLVLVAANSHRKTETKAKMAFENGLKALRSLHEVRQGMFWEFAKRAWPEQTARAITSSRRSAYRRTSGQLLSKMSRAGLVEHFIYEECDESKGGYRLTRTGKLMSGKLVRK